jgi:hypothetical protein
MDYFFAQASSLYFIQQMGSENIFRDRISFHCRTVQDLIIKRSPSFAPGVLITTEPYTILSMKATIACGTERERRDGQEERDGLERQRER